MEILDFTEKEDIFEVELEDTTLQISKDDFLDYLYDKNYFQVPARFSSGPDDFIPCPHSKIEYEYEYMDWDEKWEELHNYIKDKL